MVIGTTIGVAEVLDTVTKTLAKNSTKKISRNWSSESHKNSLRMKSCSALWLVAVIVAWAANCPGANAQQCADVTAMANFTGWMYEGRWYQYGVIPNRLEINGSCSTVTYTASLTDPNTVWDWVNRMFIDSSGEYTSMEGTARLADDSRDGKLLVSLPFTELEANYWVLETDYDTFALVYGCNIRNDVPYGSSWLLTREASPTPETVEDLYTAVVANNIEPSDYVLVRQDETCEYV